MDVMTKKFIAITLSCSLAAGGLNYVFLTKFNESVEKSVNKVYSQRLDIDNPDLMIDQMFENNVKKMDTKDFCSKKEMVATGEQLKEYLVSHDMNEVCIDGTWITKDGDTITLYSNSCDYVFVGEDQTYASFLSDNESINSMEINSISYSDLEDYVLEKEVYVSNIVAKDREYTESYYLVKK